MFKRVATLLLLLLSLLSVNAEKALYVVTAKSLNVRVGPGTQYYSYGRFNGGDTILVKGKKGEWAIVQDGTQTGYVSTRYIRYIRTLPDATPKATSPSRTIWDKLYMFVKIFLWFWVIVAILSFFINQTVFGYAMWMIVMCGIGALIGWIFWDNSTAGAVVVTGMELVVIVFFFTLLAKNPDLAEWRYLAAISRYFWALLSLPFFTLNLLQFWLSKPWRPLMKRNLLPDKAKPAVRRFLRILQLPFYIALFPLRFINAVYYDILIYNLYAWSNYIVEVFAPSDMSEGTNNAKEWAKYLPKRISKYCLYHGTLTFIESIVWAIIDTFVPAVTLYHGTAAPFADNMLCDPHRNGRSVRDRGWKTGVWNVGGGNYAGDGIYFGIFRSTLRNYQKGSSIAARVTMGKTIDTVLMPDYVYATAGQSGAKAVSNWGLNHGYVTGEWWRSGRGTNWWEICLYDRQNRYNESWRIRPIYAIYSYSGIMQRIKGGPAHWLFRKQVIEDIKDTLQRKIK